MSPDADRAFLLAGTPLIGWLGHRSITVTMDVYGRLFPFLNEALAERLDDVFTPAAAKAPAEPPDGKVVALRERTRA